MPEELREQVPLMKEALQTMNIPILTLEGYEADDILGTVAKHCQAEGIEVSIVPETETFYSWQMSILRSVFQRPAVEPPTFMIIIRMM